MSRGVAIWSMCCLAFGIYIGLFTVFPFLFEEEIISALFGVLIAWWGYLITFAGGVMALNVFGVIGEVVDVNVRESRTIRRGNAWLRGAARTTAQLRTQSRTGMRSITSRQLSLTGC